MDQKITRSLLAPTVILEACGDIPDCAIIKDSLAHYRKKPGMPGFILHNLPYIEVLIALQGEKMPNLQKALIALEEERLSQMQINSVRQIKSIIMQADAEKFEKGLITLINAERDTGPAGHLCYQFIESKALEGFCGLSGDLKWNEITRKENRKEHYDFDGKKVSVPLSPMESTLVHTKYSMPALANQKFYGSLRAAFLSPSIVVYNSGGFYERIQEIAWGNAVKQLEKEHPNPDVKTQPLKWLA